MRYTPALAMEAVNQAFLRIPREELRALWSRKEKLSRKHGVIMLSQRGKVKVIDVQLRPWIVDSAQIRFFHQECLTLRSALARLMPMYLANPKVQRILPLEPQEHAWMVEANARRLQRPQAVLDRLDTTATFATPGWREGYWFLEPNSVGIGGVHYIPAACHLVGEWVLPALKRYLPNLRLVEPTDIRQLLLALLIRHSKAIGRRLKRVAFVEDRSAEEGTDEFSSLARYFSRLGLSAVAADPRDLVLRRGEVTLQGKTVDLVYRDTEITELLEMARENRKRSLEGIRQAFMRNQVVSSIAGEFDHKSAWELFTNPEFSPSFTLCQRRLFRAHVLWTRLLFPRRTTAPKGKSVDLVAFARRNRESLVIKPNRAYGGEGVVFGHQVTQRRWERELERGLRRQGTHCIQQAAFVQAELFPVVAANGRVRLDPFYAVSGLAATRDGIAFLGRSSKESVVNVSRRGGLIAVWQLA